MPNAVEQPEKRKFSPSSGHRQYWIDGAADESDAHAALLSAAPATWTANGYTLYRRDPDVEVYEVGNTLWFGTTPYGPQEQAGQPAGGGSSATSFSFETTGGTQHIIASLATNGAYAAPGYGAGTGDNGGAADPNPKGGLIGVGDGENVEGVDVPVGRFAFSITKSFPLSAATASFLTSLAEIGTNDAVWSFTTTDGVSLSFEAGEVLFLGCTGGPEGNRFKVTFHFQASPNITNRKIGNITVASAKGHEYIWVRQRHVVANDRLTVTPLAAYVERVVPEIDFAQLDL